MNSIYSANRSTFCNIRIKHGWGWIDNAQSFIFVVFFLFAVVGAQPNSPSNDGQYSNYARFSPSMAIIIVIIIVALFFMGFFSIYIRHCSDASGAGGGVRRALSMHNRRTAAARGLDASVLETFPMFTYSEVKDHHIGKGALECAVCLNEFEEEETLRLIPKCDHVFHPECIDAWLASHITCPVCRSDLAAPAGEQSAEPTSNAEVAGDENVAERSNSTTRNEIVLQVDEDRRAPANPEAVVRQSSFEYPPRPQRSWSVKIFGFGKFRSHSTGHTMAVRGENLDRFTLRLPEEVRKEMLNRASLNRTGSNVTGSASKRGGGEVSSLGGGVYRKMEKLDTGTRSDRWIFFTRGLSFKSPKLAAATAENGGRRMPVKLTSFNCLEPKAGSEDIEARPLSHEKSPPSV